MGARELRSRKSAELLVRGSFRRSIGALEGVVNVDVCPSRDLLWRLDDEFRSQGQEMTKLATDSLHIRRSDGLRSSIAPKLDWSVANQRWIRLRLWELGQWLVELDSWCGAVLKNPASLVLMTRNFTEETILS